MPVKTLESASHRTFLSSPSQASQLELFDRTNSSSCVSPKSCRQEPRSGSLLFHFSLIFSLYFYASRNTIRNSLGSLLAEPKIPVHFTVASHDAKPSHKTWRIIAYQRRDNTMRWSSTMLFRHQRSGHIHGVWNNQWFCWYGHHSL